MSLPLRPLALDRPECTLPRSSARPSYPREPYTATRAHLVSRVDAVAKFKGARVSTNRQRSFAKAWKDGSRTAGAAHARPTAACTPACKRSGWSTAGARSTDTAAAAARMGHRKRRRRTLRKHVNS